MVPAPGETPGDWWTDTGHGPARAEQAARDGRKLEDDPDLLDAFFHDVPADVTAKAMAKAMANGAPVQSSTPFILPWPLKAWPDVPTRFLQGSDDRFFPVEFQRRVARDRLGITIDEMPGGHLIALSQPELLASHLERYRAETLTETP
jgi:pimeloyl-ACP methyl ester carboxylesterase